MINEDLGETTKKLHKEVQEGRAQIEAGSVIAGVARVANAQDKLKSRELIKSYDKIMNKYKVGQ